MPLDEFIELARLLPEPMLLVAGNGRVLAANPALAQFLGLASASLVGKALVELVETPPEKATQYLAACSRSGQMVIGALALRADNGQVVECRCQGALYRPRAGAVPALVVLRLAPRESAATRFNLLREKIEQLSKEIMVRKRAESLIDGQRQVLELIVHGAPLGEVLAALTSTIEGHASKETYASVLILDPDGIHLRHGAAPRLPEAYNRAVDGVAIGPLVGSCGTAAYTGEMVIAADIATDPRWTDYRELALSHGLRACWSTPISSAGGRVLGTFAMYHPEPCEPSAYDLQLIAIVSRTASIVIERKRAEKERAELLAREQRARREAETASRAKDEFLATVSHELRTPLQAILGWTRLLGTGQLDDSSAARALDTIERNVMSQAQLIEDMLDFSRIVSGKMRLNVRPVELAGIIDAAVNVVRPAADAKGIRLAVTLDPPCVPVAADPERLQQVLWNLLSNAVKFTPKGGRVCARVERIDSHIAITVSDNGQGISASFLPYVFDRFRQADGTTTRQHGGLGLGLAIARHLVELHGGTLRAHSEGEGKGAAFTVDLPLLAVYEPQRPTFALLQQHSPAIGDEAQAHGTQQLSGLRVLVVDDEPDARELLAMVLHCSGAEVETVASAAEALDAIERLRPDILVSDIEMPGEDGYALIRKVRMLDGEQGGETPALALTAHARPADRVRALSAGYQMHVAKPVEPAELVLTIASLASRTLGPGGVAMVDESAPAKKPAS